MYIFVMLLCSGPTIDSCTLGISLETFVSPVDCQVELEETSAKLGKGVIPLFKDCFSVSKVGV